MEALIALLLQYRYLILFPLACFEGPILGFVVGVLVSLGQLDPVISFGILILGDVIPDGIYYAMGRFSHKKNLLERFGPKIGVAPGHVEVVRTWWFNHTMKTMLVTKFAYGLSTPLLITAGLVKLPFYRFWTHSVPLSFAQYSVLMGLGYFFGGSFAVVESTFGKVQLGVLALVVFAGLYYFFTSTVRKQFFSSKRK